MKYGLLALSLFFPGFLVFCQFKTEVLLNLQESRKTIHSTLYPIGHHGVLLLSEDSTARELTWYSTDLEKRSAAFFEEDGLTDLGVFATRDSSSFSWVFHTSSNWVVQTLNPRTALFSSRVFAQMEPSFIPSVPSGAVRIADKLFLDGKIRSKPCLLVLDLLNGRQEILELPGINPRNGGRIVSLTADHVTKRVAVLFRTSNSRKKGALNLVFLSPDELSAPLAMQPIDSDYFLVDGQPVFADSSHWFVAGTYALLQGSNKVSGFYFSAWENGDRQFIRYYAFTDWKDYMNYLPDEQLKRIELIRKRRPDVENYVESNLVFHPVYTRESGYRLLGEVYYEKFDSVEVGDVVRDSLSLFGVSRIKRKEYRSLGFEYTHVAVLDLDSKGAIVNNYCFPVDLGKRTRQVTPQLDVYEDETGGTCMKYLRENGEMILTHLKVHAVETSRLTGFYDEGACSDQLVFKNCLHWYGGHYLVYGKQRIDVSKKPKSVFRTYQPSICLMKKITGNF